MKMLLLVVALCVPVAAQKLQPWHYSVAALAAATAVDIHSTVGGYELNPVLGRGPFGPRQATIKVSIVGGVVLAQYLIQRKWKKARKSASSWSLAIACHDSVLLSSRSTIIECTTYGHQH